MLVALCSLQSLTGTHMSWRVSSRSKPNSPGDTTSPTSDTLMVTLGATCAVAQPAASAASVGSILEAKPGAKRNYRHLGTPADTLEIPPAKKQEASTKLPSLLGHHWVNILRSPRIWVGRGHQGKCC